MKYLFAIAAALAATAPLAAQLPSMPNSAARGPDFIETAAASDLFEIEQGRLAAERATDPRVKALGRELAEAHERMSRALMQAARAADLPAPAPKLNPGQRRQLALLEAARGSAFDKLYLQQQHEAHADAIGLLTAYSQLGAEPPLRQSAATALPMVKGHAERIKALQLALR